MRRHRFASHTPEERRRLSDLGHIVEGLLFGAVGLAALIGNVGIASSASTVWPILMLLAGVTLLVLIYPSHPLEDWPVIWRDAQQRQHTLIGTAIVVAGAAERLRGKALVWSYVWPTAVTLIGIMFLIHEQHGTSEAAARAVRLHRFLGIALIVAALLKAGELILGGEVLSVLWPVALLVAAVQLTVYREPKGAYETEHGRLHK